MVIVIILLSIVTTGVDLFSFLNEKSRFAFNSYGITEYSIETGEAIGKQFFPMFIGFIALVMLAFLCLMSYKNLARQLQLGRMVFYMSLIGVLAISGVGEGLLDVETDKREMSVGFILFVAGFPFTFLANIGIKRDKKLLDSLNRLR